jgi:hypothetical protein
LTLDSSAGTITGTLGAGTAGTSTVVITATDSTSGTPLTGTVSITFVIN